MAQDNFIEYKDERDVTETYNLPTTIGPDDGRHLFRYIGVLLSYITPHDLTVGMQ